MIDRLENRAAKTGDTPKLSVLIPYYRDDPSALLSDLLVQAEAAGNIEILIYDDGTKDAQIRENLCSLMKKSTAPVRLFFAHNNKGRAQARNQLKSEARAKWVLFLDADMRPQNISFLDDYLEQIRSGQSDIIFGGFTVSQKKQSADTELHRAYSKTSDCLDVEKRSKNGPQFVCSSNLCMRKRVLDAEPFDTGFVGWGWEDSEWAARVAKSYTLTHADIPALHLGLESTNTLLSRFKNSGQNYVRFTNAHPELAQNLKLYRLSKRLKTVPGQRLMRPVLSTLVRCHSLPTRIRLLALKLWRASWYAEVVT